MRIESPVEEPEGGRLAGSGGTDEGHRLAGLNVEDVLHGGSLAVVGEAHVLERHLAAEARHVLRMRPVVHRGRGVQDLEELPHLRRLHEELIDEAHRLLEAADQHGGDRHEGDDLADGGETVKVQPCRRGRSP